MHRIDGPGATVDNNRFTEGDPVGGVQATLVTDDWLNAVQEELMSILAAAGVAPVKGASNQVLSSLRTLNASIVGTSRNSKMNVSADSATAIFTADQLAVCSSLTGATYKIGSFNKTINIATVGAGGMDVGTAPVNGWVAIYAIYNPITGVSALLAVNATSAVAPEVCAGVLPSGYTASALVSVWGKSTAAGLLKVATQVERSVGFAPVTVVNLSAGQPSFTSINISNAVPPNAKEVAGTLNGASNTSVAITMQITPDGVIDIQQITQSNSIQSIGAFRGLKLSTRQVVYYRLTGATGPTYLINISQYAF